MVSELFEMRDSVQDRIGIVEWGIKMTTLEDGRNIISYHIFCDFNVLSVSTLFLFVSFSLSFPLSLGISVSEYSEDEP